MKFSERLYEKLQPIWRQNHNHPFVEGMGDGTLEKEKFRFYMIQDYLYLIDYAKLFAIGAMKATDVQTMGKFAALLDSTLNEEMSLHREYAKKFEISEKELEKAQPSPTTLAYTHYMLHVGQSGTLAELVAALLPCMWSYWEIGKELSEKPGANNEFYREWIEMYSSEEFGELATWCINLFDSLTEDKSEAELEKLEEIFLNTTRFEYMFWDMAYNEAMWPIYE
ncbi:MULTISPECIES: thiaminase II [Priestia]|jgi:thiaminase/transcriptional activator TenA|uniref:Aminopyrimidine aminohydrolase n=3 Tax=Priestia TaxID=2800373 RepID=D5E234_PRIM1|nr:MULTISPECIES: thiaminase II [Priestia]AVX07031.1 thiaminase II [Bacillus sp. Y-01]KOP73225.1 TENA/THI-4 family protein [Bacillus sp. FJAT-21351]KQU25420.1 thiaminase II [Bacillus sp. Leaf75]KRF52851.1 thiaminase II [Bacillus sp. Soil531]MBZ5479563.1 thiaminase II [Bacillus sp. T_4]MCF6794763.1 thiaminase II [Bacillus sp. ET1]MDH6656189.1 thiaminase/transcriptional activator TenA [Bacillus sp. PvP124]MDP9578110.1 thiaminase/transcriptional activator TenA [Bacillus sp. 1751]MEB2274418.1 t